MAAWVPILELQLGVFADPLVHPCRGELPAATGPRCISAGSSDTTTAPSSPSGEQNQSLVLILSPSSESPPGAVPVLLWGHQALLPALWRAHGGGWRGRERQVGVGVLGDTGLTLPELGKGPSSTSVA